MVLTNVLYEALIKYFKKLSVFGYCSYREVDKIIVVSALEELLQTYILTEDQYKLFQRVLNRLLGSSCLLPYPNMPIVHSVISKDKEAFLRLTESNDTRISHDNIHRITE